MDFARRPAMVALTLALTLLALAVAARPASAVSVMGVALAEDWANTYGQKQCRQDAPECTFGLGGRCRQEGKFQVTCYAYKEYEIEPSDGLRELWTCERRIRYTVEKRPWYQHKKWIPHTRFLGPWTCPPHRKVRDY
jgi:hypothetical protein